MQTTMTNNETFPPYWHTLAALRIYGELANTTPDAHALHYALMIDEGGILTGRDDFRAVPQSLQPVVRAEVLQYAARAATIDGPTGTYAIVQFQAPVSVSFFAQFDPRLVEAHQAALTTAVCNVGIDREPVLRDPVLDTYQSAGVMLPALWSSAFLPLVGLEALAQGIGTAYLQTLRRAVEALGYPTLGGSGATFEIPPTHDATSDDVAP